jgi:Bacteriophage lambda head decoration protein D
MQYWSVITAPATILGGQGVLTVGTALGIVTATGKLKILNSLNTDGSQALAAVLNKTIDTTSGDVANTPVIIGNCGFPKGALKYGGADTDAAHFGVLGQAKSGVSLFVY